MTDTPERQALAAILALADAPLRPLADLAQVGEALGPAWERFEGGWQWVRSIDQPAVYVVAPAPGSRTAEWAVEHYQGGPRRVLLVCPSPGAAVAVALHLIAAGQLASGEAPPPDAADALPLFAAAAEYARRGLETPAVDWRDMFGRYSEIVAEAEGVDFLDHSQWPADEWAAIEALAETPPWDRPPPPPRPSPSSPLEARIPPRGGRPGVHPPISDPAPSPAPQ